jgi:hypothetical protein
MITISHIIEPLIYYVLKYATPAAQHLPTFRDPVGVNFQIKVAPLISDVEASHKGGGFMAHATTLFCSFCPCTADQIEDLNLQSWTLCQGAQVLEQAQVWLNTTTKSGCKAQAQSTGV